MIKRTSNKAVLIAASKLTRPRAEKISAIEGMKLSRPLREAFEEFDRKGVAGDERRASILARFQKKSA